VKASAWREKGDIELREQADQIRRELFDARFRSGQDEVEERGKFKKMRRELARVLTLLRERERGIRGARSVGAPGKES
jgi:large subunit ribosomal protein L29